RRLIFTYAFKLLSIIIYNNFHAVTKTFKKLSANLKWKFALLYIKYGHIKYRHDRCSVIFSQTMFFRQCMGSSTHKVRSALRVMFLFRDGVSDKNLHLTYHYISRHSIIYFYQIYLSCSDIETFDLEDFKYNSVNITAFRLVDVEDPRVSEILEQMERFQPIGHAILNRSGIIQAEPALMYDSVHVFAKGLASLDRGHVLRPTNLSCEQEQPWDDGLSLYNYINSVSSNIIYFKYNVPLRGPHLGDMWMATTRCPSCAKHFFHLLVFRTLLTLLSNLSWLTLVFLTSTLLGHPRARESFLSSISSFLYFLFFSRKA
ncbi:hypothetical protein L9F63_018865, partial [Diploptera punctata]